MPSHDWITCLSSSRPAAERPSGNVKSSMSQSSNCVNACTCTQCTETPRFTVGQHPTNRDAIEGQYGERLPHCLTALTFAANAAHPLSKLQARHRSHNKSKTRVGTVSWLGTQHARLNSGSARAGAGDADKHTPAGVESIMCGQGSCPFQKRNGVQALSPGQPWTKGIPGPGGNFYQTTLSPSFGTSVALATMHAST